ncbi:MAG TPA: methyltransferase domain-containing protein [Pseudonocardia sp.]|jgi:2-polyprenyl-3-methyl-5-hydroxy-6-metoxy-1,4-benzoquinol methylase|uniref:methyltransferase domain-containing protein n=1 Tax=Pseudonocardia sp. TaxID=60912 RepID=UPI002B4B1387|nr:methyltransferase domain-containing protein [Pseudonocardia sp.]HLU55110.1 methyltransferase domain-containing protein [Pseudonocardia sp.]
MPTPTLDERLLEAATGTLELFGVYLGTRLGLYRSLAERGRLTAPELAEAAGIHPRYAQEWLEQQAVAGFVAVDDPSRPADARRYRLPADHVGVFVDPEHPAHLAPFADAVVGVGKVLDEVVEAYRTGGGVPYSHYGPEFRRGQGGMNRPAFASDLTGSWLPAAGVTERLSRPGARIADVGCGHGWSTIAMARAYPQAEVIGYDLDEASVAEARAHAEAAGVGVRFVQADAQAVAADGPFDLVVVLEALHDMARPVEGLAAWRKALADGGSVIVVDEKVAATFTAPGDAIERLMYGWSIAHCLPASLAEQPSAGLGTVLREDDVRRLAAQAGFASTRVAEVDAGFFRVYRLEG